MSRPVKQNSTGNLTRVRVFDEDGLPLTGVSYNAAGLQIWYTPLGGLPVQITLSAGNWTEAKHGWYEVAVPDSAYTGTAPLQFSGEITGGTVEGPEHVIVGYDPLAEAVGAATAAQADEILGMPGPGSGDLPIVPTVKSSGLAVRGVKVTIQGTTRYDTTGEDGTAQLNVESTTDDVDYMLLITPPSNYAPVENVVVTVPAGATDPIEVPIELTAVDVIAEPDDPALCNVAVDVITQHGRRPDDAIVWAVPADKLPFAVESLVVTEAVTYATNSSGRAVVTLLQGEAVKIVVKFGEVQKVIDFTVPNQPTAKATVRV